jgi:hypothetical protein
MYGPTVKNKENKIRRETKEQENKEWSGKGKETELIKMNT